MSNSALIKHVNISPYKNSPRNDTIQKITIHHMAATHTIEQCGNTFQTAEASTNYGVGGDGRIGLYVNESDRSWGSSSSDNDHQAVTMEVANSYAGGEWPVSDTAYSAMIDLTVDICWRNGITKLIWTGDETGTLTIHKFFTATACPGPYLEGKMANIAFAVNERLAACRNIKTKVVTALDKLKNQSIIDTPDYWINNYAAINYLGDLIIKMADAPKTSRELYTPNVNVAIDRLGIKGIVDDPAYWKNNCGRLQYLEDIIIKVAKRLD